MYDQINS
jgi:hypothetical protein